MLHKSTGKLNKEKTPLATISNRGCDSKNHTDQGMGQMQDSPKLSGIFYLLMVCNFRRKQPPREQHGDMQEPWRGFFSLLPPAGQATIISDQDERGRWS